MPVTTRIVAADELAATYTFTIEHDGHSLTMGPADAHELATQMEERLAELVCQLKVAERVEVDRLEPGRGPSPHASGPPEPAHGRGEGPQ